MSFLKWWLQGIQVLVQVDCHCMQITFVIHYSLDWFWTASLSLHSIAGVALVFAVACKFVSSVVSGTLLWLLNGTVESSPEIYGKCFCIMVSLYIIEPNLALTLELCASQLHPSCSSQRCLQYLQTEWQLFYTICLFADKWGLLNPDEKNEWFPHISHVKVLLPESWPGSSPWLFLVRLFAKRSTH